MGSESREGGGKVLRFIERGERTREPKWNLRQDWLWVVRELSEGTAKNRGLNEPVLPVFLVRFMGLINDLSRAVTPTLLFSCLLPFFSTRSLTGPPHQPTSPTQPNLAVSVLLSTHLSLTHPPTRPIIYSPLVPTPLWSSDPQLLLPSQSTHLHHPIAHFIRTNQLLCPTRSISLTAAFCLSRSPTRSSVGYASHFFFFFLFGCTFKVA